MAAEQYVVDLAEIKLLHDEIGDVIRELDGRETTVDFDRGRGRHNDPEQAAMSRDLLRLVELCRVMGAEFTQVYWTFKGYPDPRWGPAQQHGTEN